MGGNRRGVLLGLAGIVLALALAGPYLIGGLRTEQVAIYGALAVAIAARPRALVRNRSWDPLIVCAWAAFVVWVVGVGLFTLGGADARRWLAGVDDLVLPLALILAVFAWFQPSSPGFRRGSAYALVGVGVLSTALALGEAAFGTPVVRGLLASQVGAVNVDASVGMLAAQNGRFSGLFNQPAEAGAAYGLALFALIYLHSRKRVGSVLLVLLWSAITIGGLLSLSKVFLAGLAVGLLLQARPFRQFVLGVAGSIVGGGGLVLAAAAAAVPYWGGAAAISIYVNWVEHGASLPYVLSGGRYGQGPTSPVSPVGPPGSVSPTQPPGPTTGTVSDAVSTLSQHNLWVGAGPAGLAIPYDSAWFAALILGGVVGVVLMAVFHVAVMVRLARARTWLQREEWRYALATVVLVVIGSFGLPLLTANRAGSWVWLVLASLLIARPPEPGSEDLVSISADLDSPNRRV